MSAASDDLVMYGNLLVNHPDKLEMLSTTLPAWTNYWDRPSFLRFRGSLAEEARKLASSLPHVSTATGSKFRTWKAQALADVQTLKSRFVFVFLEDHLPAPDPAPAASVLSDLEMGSVDIFQYSWFASYGRQRSLLESVQCERIGSTVQVNLNQRLVRKLAPQNPMYFISLTSIFNRDFLMQLLRSGRPWIRRFDPHAPFDIEQRPSATWFLPVRYACPTSELGICIDDDLTTPGSSAMSRGLYPRIREERVFTHHSSTSFRQLLGRKLARIESCSGENTPATTGLRLMRKALTASDIIQYSLHAPVLRALDRRVECQTQQQTSAWYPQAP